MVDQFKVRVGNAFVDPVDIKTADASGQFNQAVAVKTYTNGAWVSRWDGTPPLPPPDYLGYVPTDLSTATMVNINTKFILQTADGTDNNSSMAVYTAKAGEVLTRFEALTNQPSGIERIALYERRYDDTGWTKIWERWTDVGSDQGTGLRWVGYDHDYPLTAGRKYALGMTGATVMVVTGESGTSIEENVSENTAPATLLDVAVVPSNVSVCVRATITRP